MNDKTRREALASAFEQAEAATPATTEEGATGDQQAAQQTSTSTVTDPYVKETVAAQGGTKPADDQQQTDDGKQVAAKPDDGKQVAAKPDDGKPAEGADSKAPVSWKPEEKLHWDKVPSEVRAIIARRELEVQQVLSRTSQARRFTEEFGQVVAPFAHLIRAKNSTPLQAVHNLMSTAAGLATGSSQNKADIIANIMQEYGVDVQVLDQVLTARAQNQGQQGGSAPGVIPDAIAQALQPIYGFMQQVNDSRTAYEQRTAEAARGTVEQFGSDKPFFEDVRDTMADFMELAAKRGENLTLDAAYQMAVSATPKIAEAIASQKKATDLSAAGATLARARRAASSVAGSPNGGGTPVKTPTTRREALEQAWEQGRG